MCYFSHFIIIEKLSWPTIPHVPEIVRAKRWNVLEGPDKEANIAQKW